MTSPSSIEHRNDAAPQGWFWSRLFGLVAPSLGWAPPLRYLLRRARVLRALSVLKSATLVEVGCGAGALLDDFARAGHSVIGLESSPEALARARALAQLTGSGQHVGESLDPDRVGTVDVVCAFDVLEHIEHDGAALDAWIGWLRPGGRLCISVPAHRSRWGPGDEWAGHWRRYDRADLLDLLRSRGLFLEHVECYGFPLANLTEWMGRRVYRRLMAEREGSFSKQQATALSGTDRGEHVRLFRWLNTLLGRFMLRVCMRLQDIAAGTDWGSGYLVLARRP